AGDLLAELASGRRVAALAVGLHTVPDAAFPAVRLADGVLHGELTGIADAAVADLLLVPADDGGLHAVRAADATVTPRTSLDLTRP
ncbi:acyl-CoA dehydrogenase, partial [Streptomyces sp. TRM76130]|nr:acyl-CoA dehydrogenase [Streptomyces sp. TRM76130]